MVNKKIDGRQICMTSKQRITATPNTILQNNFQIYKLQSYKNYLFIQSPSIQIVYSIAIKDQLMMKDTLGNSQQIYHSQHNSQEQLQQLISTIQKNREKLKCSMGNELLWRCINQHCPNKNSLYCSVINCLVCSINHQNCLHSSSIDRVQIGLIKAAQYRKQMMMQIYRLEEEMISQIRSSRKHQIESYQQIVRNGFAQFEKQHLSSQKSIDFLESIKFNTRQLRQQIIDNLRITTEMMVNQLKEEKQRIIQGLSQAFSQLRNRKEQTVKYEQNEQLKYEIKKTKMIHRQIKKLPNTNGLKNWRDKKMEHSLRIIRTKTKSSHNHYLEDSVLLSANKEKINFINLNIYDPSSIKLLYRASEHKLSPIAFHKFCDNISGTLVLVKTNYGKILGGFTKMLWKPPNNDSQYYYKADKKENTFIFSLDSLERLNYINHNRALYCSKMCGPSFGDTLKIGGYSSNNSALSLNGLVQDSQRQKQILKEYTGASNGVFKTVEYQVYQVKWDNPK